MIEIVFAIVAAICLIGLFIAHPFGRGRMKPWMNLVAIVLVLTPGLISLVSAFRPFLASDPFVGEAKLRRVTRVAADLNRADHFLVRAFHVIHGDERHPLLVADRVVRRGERMTFSLPGGAEMIGSLQTSVSDGPHNHGEPITRLHFEWDAWAQDAGGELRLSAQRPALPGERFPVFETRLGRLPSDRAPIGALQRSGRHDASLLMFVQPLDAPTDVEAISAEGWWKRHADAAVARFRSLADENYQGTAWGSSWRVGGDAISGIAALVLLAAMLLLLSDSRHWVRVVCVFILFATLYVGTIDRAVLRLRVQALSFESERTQAAAVVDAAGSRFHPVTAAEHLVAVAADDARAEEVRETAVGMLSTPNLLPHVRRVGADRVFATLVDGSSERLSVAARRATAKLTAFDRAAQAESSDRDRKSVV